MVRQIIDIEQLRPVLEQHIGKFPATVKAAVRRYTLDALTFVTKNRLSFSREGPPHPEGLRVQTGTARRSVQTDTTLFSGQGRVVGRLGSPLRYVRAHELGFVGRVQVPAHTRRLVALEQNRKWKVTKKSVKAYKAAVTSGRKTTMHVRAHTRDVRMSARLFFKGTLFQTCHLLPARIIAGLRYLAATGKAPSPGEL